MSYTSFINSDNVLSPFKMIVLPVGLRFPFHHHLPAYLMRNRFGGPFVCLNSTGAGSWNNTAFQYKQDMYLTTAVILLFVVIQILCCGHFACVGSGLTRNLRFASFILTLDCQLTFSGLVYQPRPAVLLATSHPGFQKGGNRRRVR